jgi:hypothetical protein
MGGLVEISTIPKWYAEKMDESQQSESIETLW